MSTFLFTAKEGGLDLGSEFNRVRLKEELKQNEGKRYRIERIEPFRSNQQNKFYWLYLGIIAQETGNEAEDLHEMFKAKFLPRKFVSVKGKDGKVFEAQVPTSTTKLKKLEFGEYMDRIAALTHVPVPNPKDLEGYISNY